MHAHVQVKNARTLPNEEQRIGRCAYPEPELCLSNYAGLALFLIAEIVLVNLKGLKLR